MRLATFSESGRTRLGVVQGDEVIDVGSSAFPVDMITLLRGGAAALRAVRGAIAGTLPRYPLGAVRLEPPVMNPRKFLILGGSYSSHIAEVAHLGISRPKHQTWSNKQVTAINGPYDPIHAPRISDTLDYEGELALVIGRRARHLRPECALEAVAGYLVCNDVSVREWQLRSPTATLGKSFDTHAPIGPWIVTPDELTAIDDLAVRTWVNGELRQNGRTSDLIYRFSEMLVELSTVFTLEPGDIVSTGSPAGVGGAMQPPKYLEVGDVCRVEVEGIGYIENPIVPEPLEAPLDTDGQSAPAPA